MKRAFYHPFCSLLITISGFDSPQQKDSDRWRSISLLHTFCMEVFSGKSYLGYHNPGNWDSILETGSWRKLKNEIGDEDWDLISSIGTLGFV